MKRLKALTLWLGSFLLLAQPAIAQVAVSNLPIASTLTGVEKIPAAQGGGCVAHTTPCTTVALTPAQIATYVATSAPITSVYQPLDSDLTSIAALTTTSFGRSLLTPANSSAARTTLGLIIGTDVQAYNANLAALAGLSTSADNCSYWTGAGTSSLYSCPSFGRSVVNSSSAVVARTTLGVTATGSDTTYAYRSNNLSDLASAATARTNLGVTATGADTAYSFRSNNLSDLANAGTARTNLGLAIGTNVQAYSANLAAISGQTTAADKLTYWTGSGTASLADFTSAGRAIVDDADASAQRTTLGLGTVATTAVTDYQATPAIPAGRFLVPDRAGSAATGTAPGANSMRMFIGYIRKAGTISQIATRVQTGVASGLITFAIYAADATTLMPTGAPIYSSSSGLSVATSNVAAVDTGLSVAITPNWYWFASNGDTLGGTAAFISIATSSSGQPAIIGSTSNNTTYSITGQSKAQTYGTWPTLTGNGTTDSLTDVVTATVPMIWVKM
jgi:hypothetical protein